MKSTICLLPITEYHLPCSCAHTTLHASCLCPCAPCGHLTPCLLHAPLATPSLLGIGRGNPGVEKGYPYCYHLSKWLNCSCGICSGLVIWWPRCTVDALSKTRHIILNPLPFPVIVVVTLNGGVNRMMPVSSMTPVSVLAPVPFPQLSPHVCSYCPIIPSLCALGQQVITLLSCLIVLSSLVSLSSLSSGS